MPNNMAPLTLRGALNELARARDAARVQLHLLSKEARDRKGELEAGVATLEHEVGRGLDHAAARALTKAREVALGVQGFVTRHAPGRSTFRVTVATVMTRPVHACSPGDSLHRAAQIMWDNDCGSVPVVDAQGKLVGMLTDRDLCMASFTQGRTLSEATAESVMSRAVRTCSASDTLETLLDLMRDTQVRRVPIVDDTGKLTGIVALCDVTRYVQSQGSKDIGPYYTVGLTVSAISERRGAGLSDVRAAE